MRYTTGELLFFIEEEITVMVVMANEQGVRYIDPINPVINDDGSVKSSYMSNKDLYESTTTLGNVRLHTNRAIGVTV